MRYHPLGQTGLRVSELCLGTMTFGTGWGFGADADTSRADFRAFADAELVEATPQPFLQAVTDLHVDRNVHGRAVLIGDAAFTPRPHTAASTSKAILDAVTLACAVAGPGTLDAQLSRWGQTQLGYGRSLVSHGRRLGVQSGLGPHDSGPFRPRRRSLRGPRRSL